ncbi:hypothetical protein Tco_1345522 [Tanacetum coccineum]
MYIMTSRPRTRVSVQALFEGVTYWYPEPGYREPDYHVESVDILSFPGLNTYHSLIFLLSLPVCTIGAAAVAFTSGVLELDTHSSSEADPSESCTTVPYIVAPSDFHLLCVSRTI